MPERLRIDHQRRDRSLALPAALQKCSAGPARVSTIGGEIYFWFSDKSRFRGNGHVQNATSSQVEIFSIQ
jgi:hypothetical protein